MRYMKKSPLSDKQYEEVCRIAKEGCKHVPYCALCVLKKTDSFGYIDSGPGQCDRLSQKMMRAYFEKHQFHMLVKEMLEEK